MRPPKSNQESCGEAPGGTGVHNPKGANLPLGTRGCNQQGWCGGNSIFYTGKEYVMTASTELYLSEGCGRAAQQTWQIRTIGAGRGG